MADQQNTNLARYGARDAVRELAQRLFKMVPGVRECGEQCSLALAQISINTGLDPFTNELWAIPKRRQGKIVGFSVATGIRGLRRAARAQAERSGGVFPFYRPSFRMLDDDERELADLRDGDRALVCELEIILPAQHPWYANNDHGRFTVSGVGIFRQGEQTRMEPFQVVRKRAEADALRAGFDLPFGDDGDQNGGAAGPVSTVEQVDDGDQDADGDDDAGGDQGAAE